MKERILKDISAICNQYRILKRSLTRQRMVLNCLLPVSCDKHLLNKLYLSLCVAEELLEEAIACTEKYSVFLQKQEEGTKTPS
jgi:hypothetical protein